jgi:hypothetical protein
MQFADDTKEARNPISMSVGRRTVVITRLKYIIIVRGGEGKQRNTTNKVDDFHASDGTSNHPSS